MQISGRRAWQAEGTASVQGLQQGLGGTPHSSRAASIARASREVVPTSGTLSPLTLTAL